VNRTDACFELAQEAATLLAVRMGKVPTEYKGDLDPVTEADHAAEAFLFRELMAIFPEDGFLAEEGSSRPSRSGYLWVADPLDGTVNFAHRHPYFAVSLGLLKDGLPIAGTVVHGTTLQAWTAERGAGAFQGKKRLQVSQVTDLNRALASTDFPYDREARLGRGITRVQALLASCQTLRIRGSAALELCRVAEGSLELFAGDGTHAWDLAAGQIIIEEAGGRLTDWRGQPLDLLSESRWPLATNGHLHEAALELAKGF